MRHCQKPKNVSRSLIERDGKVVSIHRFSRLRGKTSCMGELDISRQNIEDELLQLASRMAWRDAKCSHKKECLQQMFLSFIENASKYM